MDLACVDGQIDVVASKKRAGISTPSDASHNHVADVVLGPRIEVGAQGTARAEDLFDIESAAKVLPRCDAALAQNFKEDRTRTKDHNPGLGRDEEKDHISGFQSAAVIQHQVRT